ncbi:MAG: rod shape-determining protein RodA [Fusobacteria bacterium]|nr:rod shape-determining protein RodA [Fusobacteriota bacterium]
MNRDLWKKADWIFLALTLGLALMGFILSFSTGQGLTDNLVLKTGIYIALGMLGLFFIASIDYNKYKEIEKPLYFIMILILVLVLIFGKEIYGAKNWIYIGPFSIQPSEFSKIFFILVYANYLTRHYENDGSFKNIFSALLYAVPPLILILLEPDMGTTLVFIAIIFGMLFSSTYNKKYLAIIFFGALGIIVLWIFLHLTIGLPIPLDEYQIQRFTVFLNPYKDGQNGLGAGYNIIQATIAVGSGGLSGKGFLNGTQVNLLPVKESDFAFSVVGEEFGFIGSLVLIIVFFLFLLKALKIAHECLDHYGYLVTIGFISMFLFHIVENIGMNLSLMPVTGIPLPFISAAGSNLLVSFIACGIILNISMQRTKVIF